MKVLFRVSGLAWLIYCAAADSLLDKLGFVWFGLLGVALSGVMAVISRTYKEEHQ